MTARTTLRVAVAASDPARRAALAARVVELGHIVSDENSAEVVLADADAVVPELPTVVFGGAETEHAGVISTDASAEQIEAALRAVASGLSVRPARQHGIRFSDLDEMQPGVLLTPRELEVLVALSEGLSNKSVARQLDISQHTVKFHVESIFRKLGVTTRAEAVAKGLRRGLVNL
jgi:DNA-binding NarL/FixJ family response regulator